jgi:hypothetical protein
MRRYCVLRRTDCCGVAGGSACWLAAQQEAAGVLPVKEPPPFREAAVKDTSDLRRAGNRGGPLEGPPDRGRHRVVLGAFVGLG